MTPGTTPITRVGVVTKPDLGDCADVLNSLATWLQARGLTVLFDEQSAALAGLGGSPHTHTSADELVKSVDLIVLLGGDGTLLLTADRVAMAGAQTPILGVNFGSLGFLTEVRLQELYDILELVLAGSARIDERAMLRVEILRHHNHDGENEEIVQSVCVLNDVVITRGALSRMTDLSVTVNDQFVARFKADGLIVATATGSTAYNLSAGGPIVHPGVDALVLTPIAPHTLTNRPVVIPINSTLVIHPLQNADHQDVFVTFDGQIGHPLPPDHQVRVTRATRSLRLVRPTARSYYEVLREKLKWAER